MVGNMDAKGDGRMGPWLNAMGRLKKGDNPTAATARLRAAQPQIREATLPAYLRPQDRDAFLREPFNAVPAGGQSSYLRRRYERPLKALLLIVGLVLVVACANIANLLLARTEARCHELSVRRALGASRARLARQLVAESALLSGIGSLLGLLFAAWGSRVLVRQLSTPYFRAFLDLSPDIRVLGVTATAAVLTALLFGTVPALRAAAADPMEALKTARTSAYGGSRFGFASALVVTQFAISLVLVAGAGLFVRTFATLATLDIGFDRDAVLVVDTDVRRASIPERERAAFAGRLRDAVASAPGVASASVSIVLPAGMMQGTRIIEIPGGPALAEASRTVKTNEMTPGWFRTLGVPMLLGRDFDDTDRGGAPLVAIVNQAFVRHYLGTRPPIGSVIEDTTLANRRRSVSIVGVAADAIYYSLREPAPPTIYQPLAQSPWSMYYAFNLCVRGAPGSQATLSRAVANAVGRVDPSVSLTFRSLKDQVDSTFAQERLVAKLSTFFGGLALLLAAIGLYGVMAHSVVRRRTEIGIRIALGATPAAVVRMVLRHVGGLAGLGIAIGVLASLWVSRFVAALLFGIEPRDPLTLATASVVLGVVALTAGWWPSRKASRIDPMTVLKEG